MESFSQDSSYEALKTIKGIPVTRREIDTIACLLSGKGVKSIASLLSVSSRTIETYIRSLMLKFGCSSREGIIEFVEKSPHFKLLKAHYLILLGENGFPIENPLAENSLPSHEPNQEAFSASLKEESVISIEKKEKFIKTLFLILGMYQIRDYKRALIH